MIKRFVIIIILLIIVFGLIFGWDIMRAHFVAQYMANFKPPASVVTATRVKQETWQPSLSAIGTIEAINGVNLSPQQSGVITKLLFESGQIVKKGAPLVQQNTAIDKQELASFKAALVLAQQNYKRALDLNKKGYVSDEKLDQSRSTLDQAKANVDKTQVTIDQKTIEAPFAGKLGIRNIDLGQYIKPGDTVVNIQQINPLRIIFNLPQQNLSALYVGQSVDVIAPGTKNEITYPGKVTAIDSSVNQDTRNISVQAEIENKGLKLLPGMYVNIKVLLPKEIKVLTIPQSAITYNPYGDFVYTTTKKQEKVTNPKTKKTTQEDVLVSHQSFVTTGEMRGGQVAILKGLKVGDQVLTSGQLKVQNGSPVIIKKDPGFTAASSVNPAELY